MRFLMFGIGDIPITFYWTFYFVIGIIGFAISYFHRYLFLVAVAAITIFCVLDFRAFYGSLITPGEYYVFRVAISMAFAVLASLAGAILNQRTPGAIGTGGRWSFDRRGR